MISLLFNVFDDLMIR